MADFEKLKANMAKVEAVIGKDPKTVVETTTIPPVEEHPLNED